MTELSHQIVIIGGGAGGLATAASILNRNSNADVAIVEPSEDHFYQPGWTMVGGGIFKAPETRRKEAGLIPSGAKWIKASAARIDADANEVLLGDGRALKYEILIVAAGLKIDWSGIEGLEETLGRNGVTSNYRYDLAPYTWELVQKLDKGRALFTQPPMPIKCAGAPQKAMYLSCDAWRRRNVLSNIDVEFHNAGPVLFGVAAYVPALMEYVETYGINLNFGSKLVAVDGDRRIATFTGEAGETQRDFDMIHVVPPQVAPDFIRTSAIAADSGWVDVDDATLRHKKFANIFAVGDCGSMPNAKTAAAARKQAPVVAVNALDVLAGKSPRATYDGYGSCPLTVERGKIVLAEFGYGGKLLPSFPSWLLDGQRPSRLAWHLKSEALPWIYWNGMLKGREWLVKPALVG